MAWFTKPEPKLILVEVRDKTHVPVPEDEEAIRSLENHPGFQALMQRLKFQKALLTARLQTSKHKDIREVDNLQNGITWIGWLQQQVDHALAKKREVAKIKPSEFQQEQFKQILAQIEGVGSQDQN